MDFGAHADETLAFLEALRGEILSGTTHDVLIDVSALQEISPPAAIVLLAEATRCVVYAGTKKNIRGNYPSSDRAKQVLTGIGFFRAFNIKAPTVTLPKRDRLYVKTASGNKSDGRYTRPYLSLFERVAGLTDVASKRLYGALIECMDNVRAHAYNATNRGDPDLIGEWWLGGFADPVSRELALVFYDLGRGIPTTIKTKRSVRWQSYVGFGDSRILEQAVMVGLSSKDSSRRGTGLPSLREFVDLAPGGFLRVISGDGDFIYRRKKRRQRSQLPRSLTGSLIIWTISANYTAVSGSGSHDLVETGEQVELRFEHE
jgi:hypothetical protein